MEHQESTKRVPKEYRKSTERVPKRSSSGGRRGQIESRQRAEGTSDLNKSKGLPKGPKKAPRTTGFPDARQQEGNIKATSERCFVAPGRAKTSAATRRQKGVKTASLNSLRVVHERTTKSPQGQQLETAGERTLQELAAVACADLATDQHITATAKVAALAPLSRYLGLYRSERLVPPCVMGLER